MTSILPVQGSRSTRTLLGILQAHRAGQVGRRIGAVVAAEGQDHRFFSLMGGSVGLVTGLNSLTSSLLPARRGHADLRRIGSIRLGHLPSPPNRRSTAARIWLSTKCRSVMALAGHSAVQLPQPMQVAPCTSALLFSFTRGAMYGQTWTQVMQEMHLS